MSLLIAREALAAAEEHRKEQDAIAEAEFREQKRLADQEYQKRREATNTAKDEIHKVANIAVVASNTAKDEHHEESKKYEQKMSQETAKKFAARAATANEEYATKQSIYAEKSEMLKTAARGLVSNM